MTAIESQTGGGGTQLINALQQALSMEGTQDYSRTFVILTDGFVTVEKESFDLIRENLNEANFFAFGIGNSVNRFIIEGIAYVGEGEPFVITDLTETDDAAMAFREYIERPTLTNIEATFEGIDVYDVEPITIPDVFSERPIIVYGKYENVSPSGSITIHGDYADGEVTSTLSFADAAADTDENIALKYLWARKKIRLMSDYGIASNEIDTISIEEEITLLGLKYNLVTDYTSFVAVDSNAVAGVGSDTADPGDDGNVVEVEDINLSNQNQYINLIGTMIDVDGLLKFRLENLNINSNQEIYIQIRDISGKEVITQKLSPNEIRNIISIQLNNPALGMYFLSLVVNSKVVDTEKFVVSY